MTIGDRIKIRREELGLSQEELAQKLGYKSRSSINKIEHNTRQLTQKNIKAIADALDTTPSYIMGWNEEQKTTESILVPVFGMVAAGNPIEAIENIRDHIDIPSDWNGDYRGFIVYGDSMSPRILDGDILVVRRQDDAESGDIVVAMTDDGATVKKLIKHSDHITLQPFNPSYEPMYFAHGLKLWGKVVELRAKF